MLLTIQEAWQTNKRTALAEREEEGLAIRWMDSESHLLNWQLIFFLVACFHKGANIVLEKDLCNKLFLFFFFCIAVHNLQKAEKEKNVELHQEESLQTATFFLICLLPED